MTILKRVNEQKQESCLVSSAGSAPLPMSASVTGPAPPQAEAGQTDPLPQQAAMAPLRTQIDAAEPGSTVTLDASGISTNSDLVGAELLSLVLYGRERGVTVRLRGLSSAARQRLTDLPPEILDPSPAASRPREGLLESIGERTVQALDKGRRLLRLIGEFSTSALIDPLLGPLVGRKRQPIKWDRTLEQVSLIGAHGVGIVLFLNFLVGVVLALNGAAQLRQFGASIFIADLVGVAMTREMAPLITAIIVAGRSGSAIAAELGTMVVSQEIDAMRAMALPPGRYLLVPRILGLILSMPCLTVLADVAGILGGAFIGVVLLGLSASAFLDETQQALVVRDVIMGLTKSAVFALLIGLTACYQGLYVRGGAAGVGRATTASVVSSIVLCIIANAVFTTFFYYLR